MEMLRAITIGFFCFYLVESFFLYSKTAAARTEIEMLNIVVDPEIERLKEEKNMKKKIVEIEEIRDDYIMAYPELKPRLALKLIEKTADAPLIALPEALRKSIIDLGLGTEIKKLPKTIHKPTYENTGPVLPVHIS